MNYRKLTAITHVETFARGVGVDVRHDLNAEYGRGNWRAELHWYEASNIGRRREKVKRDLERIQ